jgi:periplasmic protein TonB
MRSSSAITSVVIHLLAVFLMALLGAAYRAAQVPSPQPSATPLIDPHILPGPAGGGGEREPLPPSIGRLPAPAAHRIFIPPSPSIAVKMPKLPVEPAVIEAPAIRVALPEIGDPFGANGPPSAGPGGPDGIGPRGCCGIGSTGGPGVHGPGPGSFAGHHYSSPPELVYKVEPEYSEEARKSKYEGTVVLAIVVDAMGRPRDIRVVRGLGLGLDQKAVEAVRQWRFRPAIENGKPAAAPATIEVNFRLL